MKSLYIITLSIGLFILPSAVRAELAQPLATTAEQNALHYIIDSGLVSPEAYALPLALLGEDGVPEGLELTVSQKIQYSPRTYTQAEDVRGLLVLMKNTTNKPIAYGENSECFVQYRIYNSAWRLVYNNAETVCKKTTSGLSVRYVRTIPAESVAAYEILHTEPLPAGRYHVALSMDGMFAGVKDITILE